MAQTAENPASNDGRRVSHATLRTLSWNLFVASLLVPSWTVHVCTPEVQYLLHAAGIVLCAWAFGVVALLPLARGARRWAGVGLAGVVLFAAATALRDATPAVALPEWADGPLTLAGIACPAVAGYRLLGVLRDAVVGAGLESAARPCARARVWWLRGIVLPLALYAVFLLVLLVSALLLGHEGEELNLRGQQAWLCVLVLAFFALVMAPVVATARAHQAVFRAASDDLEHCPACGYLRSMLPTSRCPECGMADSRPPPRGAPAERAANAERAGVRRGLGVAGATCCAALLGLGWLANPAFTGPGGRPTWALVTEALDVEIAPDGMVYTEVRDGGASAAGNERTPRPRSTRNAFVVQQELLRRLEGGAVWRRDTERIVEVALERIADPEADVALWQHLFAAAEAKGFVSEAQRTRWLESLAPASLHTPEPGQHAGEPMDFGLLLRARTPFADLPLAEMDNLRDEVRFSLARLDSVRVASQALPWTSQVVNRYIDEPAGLEGVPGRSWNVKRTRISRRDTNTPEAPIVTLAPGVYPIEVDVTLVQNPEEIGGSRWWLTLPRRVTVRSELRVLPARAPLTVHRDDALRERLAAEAQAEVAFLRVPGRGTVFVRLTLPQGLAGDPALCFDVIVLVDGLATLGGQLRLPAESVQQWTPWNAVADVGLPGPEADVRVVLRPSRPRKADGTPGDIGPLTLLDGGDIVLRNVARPAATPDMREAWDAAWGRPRPAR